MEGCAELATELAAARRAVTEGSGATGRRAAGAREVLAAAGEAYTAFARRRPALYDAMFTHALGLPFATPEAPAALWEAFDELARAVEPIAAEGDEPGLLTETYWASLHGLVTLMRSGRLPEESHERRLTLLTGHFAAGTD